MLLTGPQRETIGTFVPYLFHPPDEIKLHVARVVVCDTILFLNIIMIMPASQNRSNCAFRYGLLHLATKSTAKSELKVSRIDLCSTIFLWTLYENIFFEVKSKKSKVFLYECR